MLVHLIEPEFRKYYTEALDMVHRMRHDLYVVERGWKALKSVAGREYDQFDDERALYLIAFDEDEQPVCSARLRPTDDRSLLRDLFPNLVTEPDSASFGPDVWELTRFLVAEGWRGSRGYRYRESLLIAMIEAAQEAGIRHINLVCDTFFLPALRTIGWRYRHLGLPAAYDEGEAMAVEIRCERRDSQVMRERTGIHDLVLFSLKQLPLTPKCSPHDLANFIRCLELLSRPPSQGLTQPPAATFRRREAAPSDSLGAGGGEPEPMVQRRPL